MGERLRWTIAFLAPALVLVFLVVRAAWLAYVGTLNESALHLQVFNHATAIAITLWSVIIGVAASIAWSVAGRIVARKRATRGERTD